MESKPVCNVCGSPEVRRLYVLKDDYIGVRGGSECILNVEKCTNCGLIFVSNSEDAFAVDEFFWKEIVKDCSEKFGGISSADYEDKVELMEKYRENNRILDIGCGDGQFLNLLKRRGWHEFGLDHSKEAVNRARDRLNLNVVHGMAEDMDFPDNYFDVVVMWGVIEHLKNPRKALEKVSKVLRRGGLVLLYTPNVNSLFHRLARFFYLCSGGRCVYPLRKLFIRIHLFYFSPKTISRILTDSGLVPFEILRVNIDANVVLAVHPDRAWAGSRLIRLAVRGIFFAGSALRMKSHMEVYAVNGKD